MSNTIDLLGTLLLNSINASLYFLFYSAFFKTNFNYKRDWWKPIIYVAIIGAYTTLTAVRIMEPFRYILMLVISLLLFSVLLENKRIANFSAIIASYVLTMSILFVSAFISTVFTHLILSVNNMVVINLTASFIQLIGGIFIYYKIRYKPFLRFFQEIEIQVLSYIAGVIVLAIYFSFKITSLSQGNMAMLNILAVIFGATIIGSIILAIFQIKRYRERIKMQEENENLTKLQRMAFAELHTTGKVIPSVLNTLNEALGAMTPDQIETTIKEHGKEILDLTQIYWDEQKKVTIQNQKNMRFPRTSWILINNYFIECKQRAVKNVVGLEIYVVTDVKILQEIGIPQFDVVKMFADHIDNSFKEIAKSGKPGVIDVYFKMSDGAYEIVIKDNAHEFPLDVLSNLGLRSVSTNNSGDGFANTLQTMERFGGSLIICEYAPEDECRCNKSVTLRFDGENQFKIQSYRADEIKALKGESTATIEYMEKPIYTTAPKKYEYLSKIVDELQTEKALDEA